MNKETIKTTNEIDISEEKVIMICDAIIEGAQIIAEQIKVSILELMTVIDK